MAVEEELPALEELRTTIKPTDVNKGGQPTKLTPKVMEALIEAISVGCYIETAAAYVGISKYSFHEWLRRGAQERADGKNTIYVKFSNAVGKAMAELEVKCLVLLGESMKSQDAATRWMLERKFPKRWGPPVRTSIELTGKEGGPIEQKHEHSITPESLAFASAIAGALESLAVQDDPGAGGDGSAGESPSAPCENP